jgi:hypothetical protein
VVKGKKGLAAFLTRCTTLVLITSAQLQAIRFESVVEIDGALRHPPIERHSKEYFLRHSKRSQVQMPF